MSRAKSESRVVVTCDLDFGDLLAASGDDMPSVILLRQRDQTPQGTLPRLRSLLSDRHSELLSGAIISIEDSGHRLRKLPIKPDGR